MLLSPMVKNNPIIKSIMGTTEHHYHKEICTNHINIVGGAKREETQ